MTVEIMWTMTQIAERDGISKMAVSKAVKSLIAAKPETPVERDGRGRIMSVSLAHYDHFRQRHSNPAKTGSAARPTKASAIQGGEDSFEEARRQAEWLKVGRETIRHQEECAQLVRRDLVEEAVGKIGREIRALVARLQNRADDLAIAVSREGVHGARVALRGISFELGNDIADKLAALAEAAPETDPLIVDDQRPGDRQEGA